jgi:hypothetical protein
MNAVSTEWIDDCTVIFKEQSEMDNPLQATNQMSSEVGLSVQSLILCHNCTQRPELYRCMYGVCAVCTHGCTVCTHGCSVCTHGCTVCTYGYTVCTYGACGVG